MGVLCIVFFFSSRRRHTRLQGDWSSDVCSSDLCSGDEELTVSTNTDDVGALWRVGRFFSCLGIFQGDPHYIQGNLDNRHFTKAVVPLLHLQSTVVGASSSRDDVLS